MNERVYGVNVPLYGFNRGLFDPRGLARADLQRYALSAAVQTNWMANDLGAMTLRPGTKYTGSSKDNNKPVTIPFAFTIGDVADIELTAQCMRVWVDDALVTRASVSSTLSNSSFTSNLSSWTDDSDAGASTQWVTGGYAGFTGAPSSPARLYQQLSVSAGEVSTEHALRLDIERGRVTLRIGTTQGAGDVLYYTGLTRGQHSLVFTPGTTTVYVQLESETEYETLVSGCAIEAGGALELDAPWQESELPTLRYTQSGNVVYIGSGNLVTRFPRVIERRANNSWSLIIYAPSDGPFDPQNTTGMTITPSALRGDITLTASEGMFDSTHVNALVRLRSTQQLVTGSLSALDATTDYIEVQGVGGTRKWTLTLAGTWTGTVVLERAVASPDVWASIASYTAPTVSVIDDGLSNQIVYYRLRVSAYSSGTVNATLDYPNGSITGVARIVSVASSTVANAIVLIAFGGLSATRLWSLGSWGIYNGWPKVPLVAEGRLWWCGRGAVWASASDAFDVFDEDVEGDSRPIKRLLGQGAVEHIDWAVQLQRIIAGSEGAELSVMSSGDNQLITQSNVNVKIPSTQGSADIQAVHVDGGAIAVQRSQRKVMEIAYQLEPNDYAATDLTQHVPAVLTSRATRMTVQRQPNTRLQVSREDGKVAVCIFNKAEEIICWVLVDVGGVVEEVFVHPGVDEDRVYYWVKRTVNGQVVRYREKIALESDCGIHSTLYEGALTLTIGNLDEYPDGTELTARDVNGDVIENVTVANSQVTLSAPVTYAHLLPSTVRLVDSHVLYDGAPTTTLTGLGHLEGETVRVWGDGVYQGEFQVSGAQVTGLSEEVAKACVGLHYRAKFKSMKLAYADHRGTALAQRQKVSSLGLLLYNTHHTGVQVGRAFDQMFDIEQNHEGDVVVTGTIYQDKTIDMNGFDGEYTTDARVCITADAPFPATVLAAVIGMETLDD